MSMALTVPGMLDRLARERGDQIALCTIGREKRDLTYRQWRDGAALVAGALAARGVTRGDRVVVVCGDDWGEFATAYVAVQWLGATAVPVAMESGVVHVTSVAARSRAVGVIGTELVAGSWWQAIVPELEHEGSPTAPAVDQDDEAELLYTSGTTGTPRGVIATHRNLVWPLLHARGDAARVVMHGLPAGSNAGQSVMLQSLSPVPHSVIAAGGLGADPWFAAIEEHRVTDLVIVPVHGIRLVRAAPQRKYELGSVRVVRNTSAAASQKTMAGLAAIFPRAAIRNLYTTTEVWPARVALTFDPQKPYSVGRPSEGSAVRIVDDEGREVISPVVGRVQLRMEGAPSRRYDDDDANVDRSVFVGDGWIATGDLGYLDASGYLYLSGRTTDTINRGGTKLSALEIDQALEEHPFVLEACAFGLPHATLGEYPACAVRVTRRVDVAELVDWAVARLGEGRAPWRVYVVDDFPRTTTGKPVRTKLASQVRGHGKEEDPLLARVGAIWAGALALDSIPTLDADFMELGGSSLEAAEITASVRGLTGQAIRERDLFSTTSLAAYVERVRSAEPLGGGSDAA